MATTVKQLIGYLNDIKDQDQVIFYQYLLAEHTSYHQHEFDKLVEEAEESSADNLTNYLLQELIDAEYNLED